MEKTLADALMLLTKTNSKLADKVVNLEKKVNGISGDSSDSKASSKPEKLFKTPQSVIIEDFNRDAMQDLMKVFGGSQKQDTPATGPPAGGGMEFIKKLIGPALLVLGGIAALVTGLMSDGPLKGLLNILSKGGIIGGVKLFQTLAAKQIGKFTGLFAKIMPTNLFGKVIAKATGFLSGIGKFLLKPFAKLGGKGAGKGLFGTIGKLFGKFLKPVLKRIPGIGSLISWGFAISRFKSGDLVGGLIDVASGIATLFPGIGTGISIGLDVLNAFLDAKKDPDEVKPAGSGFQLGEFFGKIKDKILNNFPIKNLMQFWSGAGKVVSGDFKEGFTQMAYAIPFMKPLSEFIFSNVQESKDEDGNFSFKSFFGNIKDKIFSKILQFLPKKILGVSVRARAAGMLGIDMPIEDEDLGTPEVDSATESGLYEEGGIFNKAKLDQTKAKEATSKQLQAILATNTLNDKDADFIVGEMRRRRKGVDDRGGVEVDGPNIIDDNILDGNIESDNIELGSDFLSQIKDSNAANFEGTSTTNHLIATSNDISNQSNQYMQLQIEILKQNAEILQSIQSKLIQSASNTVVDNSTTSITNTNTNRLRDLQRSYV